jgi:hypothetical protein
MIQTEIASELIKLAEKDLQVRERLLAENKLGDGYNPVMESVHKENAVRLRDIIGKIGWPTRSKVGEEASEAAWLIVQHAIGEADFMRHCYELMEDSAEDVNPQNIAYLHDRICFFEARPQRYGTQYDDEGMYPVEDEKQLSNLRKQIQLPALDENTIAIAGNRKQMYSQKLEEDSDFQAWRRNSGWV